ncbi:hypothetical protein AB833_09280 [Chromatiales bacterium (ex Bugula neritina AB1)]|nr:hypothetical protein AB833_09280 [Chromatiales bacterium (ex Bugula neritina AB1)]
MKQLHIILGILLLSAPVKAMANGGSVHIYQDADISNHRESSEAIQSGIEIAFDEIGNEISGFKVVYKYLDHRGNVVRSKRNYQKFTDDPNALAIYSGIHSPPLIKNRTFINENEALTLVPWAAGGPITRYPSADNWIFRLSVDDTQAAPVIINFALDNQGCKSPHLLLEKTPWGDSNLRSMAKVLDRNHHAVPEVTRFSWNLKSIGARTMLREIINKGSDCIIFVGNAIEGAVIVKEMLALPDENRIPIVSHWGITGGNFHEVVTVEDREQLDLHFIQTCFSFTNSEQSHFAKQVLTHLTHHTNGRIQEPSDLKSAVGFIHAYDLTKILIQAIEQTGLTGNMERDRKAIRLALENIDQPVKGLIKTYNSPFSEFNEETNYNAHEALDAGNYCMGKYGKNNEVVISE